MVLGGIVFFATRTGTNESSDTRLEESVAPAPITLSHSYAKGAHTFTGTRTMPTPCDSVSAEASLSEEGTVEVRVTETFADGICLMRSTPMKFSTTITAPEDARVVGLLNGVSVDVVIE